MEENPHNNRNDNDTSQIYTVITEKKEESDHYANQIFTKTAIFPTQCYLVNDGTALYVKYPQGIKPDIWHTPENLKALKNIGLVPKLSPYQMEINSIFINAAPSKVYDYTPEQLLNHINDSNPNISAISTFVPRKKSSTQKLSNLKITLVTRNMANSIMSFGLRVCNCLMEPGSIRQGYYTKIPQCHYCQKFHEGRCNADFPSCPNCAQRHRRHECKNKNTPRCINCHEEHRATSNQCYVRYRLLTATPIPDIDENELCCPFGTIKNRLNTNLQPNLQQQPTTRENETSLSDFPNTTWANKAASNSIPPPLGTNNSIPGTYYQMNPLTATAPLTTYSDCLKMAIMFEEWYDTYLNLLKVFGLPMVELPKKVRNRMKNTGAYRPNSENENEEAANRPKVPPKPPNPPLIEQEPKWQFPPPHKLYYPITNNQKPNYSTQKGNNINQNIPHNYQELTTNNSFDNLYLQEFLNLDDQMQEQHPTLTGANLVPLPKRERKDVKAKNKSTKSIPPLVQERTEEEEIDDVEEVNDLEEVVEEVERKEQSAGKNTSVKAEVKPTQTLHHEKGAKPKKISPTKLKTKPPLNQHNCCAPKDRRPSPEKEQKRQSIDPEQFKSTKDSFERLASATEATAQKIYTQQLNQNKINKENSNLEPTKFQIGKNDKVSPEPKQGKKYQFKHITPPKDTTENIEDLELNLETSPSTDNSEIDVMGEIPDLTTKPNEESTSRRQLRSDSRSRTWKY